MRRTSPSATWAVGVAALARVGTPAKKAGANFSKSPQTGKLKAFTWTVIPPLGPRRCRPWKERSLLRGRFSSSGRKLPSGRFRARLA